MTQSKFQKDLSKIHARKGKRLIQADLTGILLSVLPTPLSGTWITPKGLERNTKLLPGTIQVMLFRMERKGLAESHIQNFAGIRSYRLTRKGLAERRKRS